MFLDVREWVTVGFFLTFLSNHRVPVLLINKYELWKASAKARGLYWRWTVEGFMCKWKFLSLLLIGAQWALLFIQTTLCHFYGVHKKNSLFRLWPRVAQGRTDWIRIQPTETGLQPCDRVSEQSYYSTRLFCHSYIDKPVNCVCWAPVMALLLKDWGMHSFIVWLGLMNGSIRAMQHLSCDSDTKKLLRTMNMFELFKCMKCSRKQKLTKHRLQMKKKL